MEVFLPGKSISRLEKIRKNDFAPSEKFSSYAPDQYLVCMQYFLVMKLR